ncbi:MAG: prephenate dehydratase [Candidatus Hadarchaeota archaeon]
MKMMQGLSVAVLGPRGTNTEEVAKKHWKRARLVFAKDLPEIFEKVEEGKTTYGVIPVEDSVEGDVTLSFDLLRSHDLNIVKELHLPVTHCLAARGGKDKIKVIASHPQALAHCRVYLKENFPNVEQRQVTSTGEAAKQAAKDATTGAIASERAAKIYKLNVISREVHDRGSNTTRFFVISRKPVRPKNSAKTSIIVDIPKDYPGALYQILAEFANRGINLTKILSRPARGVLGEYIFYVDFEGSTKDSKVKKALKSIEQKAAVRILGSYSYPTRVIALRPTLKSQVSNVEVNLMSSSSNLKGC